MSCVTACLRTAARSLHFTYQLEEAHARALKAEEALELSQKQSLVREIETSEGSFVCIGLFWCCNGCHVAIGEGVRSSFGWSTSNARAAVVFAVRRRST